MIINVALTMFVPKSISWNGGAPDGQVQVISGPNMVQYGTEWASSIHFLLEINIALQDFVLKSISEAGRYPDGQFWPISGHFLAIFGPVHDPRWSRLCFNRPFHIGNQCCFTRFCHKIDIWGWRLSKWPILGHFRPFVAPYIVQDDPDCASIVHF